MASLRSNEGGQSSEKALVGNAFPHGEADFNGVTPRTNLRMELACGSGLVRMAYCENCYFKGTWVDITE